jgi:hypothetical protein
MKIIENQNQVFINDSVFCKSVVSYAMLHAELTEEEFIDSFGMLWGYDAEDQHDMDDLKLLHQYVIGQWYGTVLVRKLAKEQS